MAVSFFFGSSPETMTEKRKNLAGGGVECILFDSDCFKIKRRHYRRMWRTYTWMFALIFMLILALTSMISNANLPMTTDSVGSMNPDESRFSNRELLSVDNDAEGRILDPKFPKDLFTDAQRRQGAIVLHILGMIYMFVALAIVCDEFFIPSLDVITEKLVISEDVAGATFMAAGGSAPELFTSIIGVFISFDDVGIGTIVGSAVFNILFVLSMCAIFSKSVLELTWWPLFRDVSFYSLILITLVLCFKDSTIFWYEALILLTWYAAYVTFMKFNSNIEHFVKRLFNRAKVNNRIESGKRDSIPSNYQFNRKASTPILHGGSKFRQGLLQLMIHSIDPLYEEPPINMKNGQEITNGGGGDQQPHHQHHHHHHQHPPGTAYCPICGEDKHTVKLDTNGIFHTHDAGAAAKLPIGDRTDETDVANNFSGTSPYKGNNNNNNNLSRQSTLQENGPDPLDVSWPKTCRERLTYIFLAPIIILLWLTLPDVRRPEKRKWFVITFVGSIMWIGLYSYFMVWWATLVGETFRMPSEIMGLTFLAAGTSIPDLITSVLVARKGLGDMAVSSSVGSNIFDVAVGLPFPWLIYTMLFGAVSVNSSGMICSVMLLFLMLLFVIITIASFKWRLNIGMAVAMFILYFFFIAFTLMLEKDIIKCSSIVNFFSL